MKRPCLGLDISATAAGICLITWNEAAQCRDTAYWRAGHSISKGSPIIERWSRLENLVGLVAKIVDDYAVRDVAAEGYAYGAHGNQNDLAECHGAIGQFLFRERHLCLLRLELSTIRSEQGLPTQSRPAGTIKGKIAEVYRARGLVFSSESDMDSYAVAACLWNRVNHES